MTYTVYVLDVHAVVSGLLALLPTYNLNLEELCSNILKIIDNKAV